MRFDDFRPWHEAPLVGHAWPMGTAVSRIAAVGLAAALAVGGRIGDNTARDSSQDLAGAALASTPTSTLGTRRASSENLPSLSVGRAAWVSVSVATVWRSPRAPRPVDAPALAHPAAIETWLSEMTLAQRRDLNGRADTQALLGDRVLVLGLPTKWPGWARVAVPSQPSPRDGRGYPGWVPRRQLTARTPAPSSREATVVVRTAWLRKDEPDPTPLFRVSFGTDLGVVGETARFVRVVTPARSVRRLARSAVILHDVGQPALAPGRASLVGTAKLFVGLPYLWAGASGFGLDCSGLTWLDYRVHGITIPRDALPQSRHGTVVRQPRRGDLMFYAASGLVHHVSMYAGDGRMVHSPGTGQRVEVIPTSTPSYASQYVGSRRYLP
jgi:gamma-D-glutamyl-L-lysine dipeptidyl-peptidase